MPLEDGGRELEHQLANQNARTGRKRAERDRNVVTWRRDPGNLVEWERFLRGYRHGLLQVFRVQRFEILRHEHPIFPD